jgi:hypothetical protein
MIPWSKNKCLCILPVLFLGVTAPVIAQDCKVEVYQRFKEKIVTINEKILRSQFILRTRLENPNTPDDVIRAIAQDISRQRQQRDEMSIEWVLIQRRHQELSNCP